MTSMMNWHRRADADDPGSAAPPAFGPIAIARGVGRGPTALAAFDAALLDAGVANYNLIVLSSVIPPGSRIERRRWHTPAADWGRRLYCVLSQMREERPGHAAHAGIGWVHDGDAGHGLFVELHDADRERVVQTLWFEGVGLVVVTPLYAAAAGSGFVESLALVALVSLVVTAWSAAFNTLFDMAERRRCGRIASARPHRWRVLHAAAHEASAAVVSCPVIYAMTDFGWGEALVADLGLALAYAGYAYLFHIAFDRLRPVRSPADAPAPTGAGELLR